MVLMQDYLFLQNHPKGFTGVKLTNPISNTSTNLIWFHGKEEEEVEKGGESLRGGGKTHCICILT